MKIKLPYGKATVSVAIPDQNLMCIANPAGKITAASAETEEIRKALANPIGSEPLKTLATKLGPQDRVAILVSDYTRPTPTSRILPPLLEEMQSAGVQLEQITIVFASGLHRTMTKEEMDKALGPLASKLSAISHDAYNDPCVAIGTSKNNTPIEINRRVAEARLKLSISAIDPHHAAGWSGGGKNIMPGVSSKHAILTHHKQMLSPGVAIAVFDGNPFREDIEEIAVTVGVDFICNVLLNEDKKVARAFCGDVIKAHRAGAKFSEEFLSVSIPQPADIVIATPGGAPRDSNLWQTEGKALTRVKDVIRPGGIIILVSECAEGVGQEEFQKYIENNLAQGDFQGVLDRIKEMPFSVLTNKIARIAKLLQMCNIYIVTSDKMKSVLVNSPFYFYASVQEAFDAALAKIGPAATVLVVPEAPGVVLKLPRQISPVVYNE